ncbi:MAG: hypothetical protein ACRDIB_13905 [Ardenticatenaceae bacterium]
MFTLYYYKESLPTSFYQEDGPFEWLTALLLLTAAFLIGGAAYRLRRAARGTQYWWVLRGYLLLAALFFLFAMEEVSWGQRIVGWKTPAAWQDINYQDETNLHNVVSNRLLFNVLPLFLLPPVLLSIAAGFGQRHNTLTRLLLPHPTLIGLALLVAFPIIVSLPDRVLLARFASDELLEQLVALFAFFYGIRIGGWAGFRATGIA